MVTITAKSGKIASAMSIAVFPVLLRFVLVKSGIPYSHSLLPLQSASPFTHCFASFLISDRQGFHDYRVANSVNPV